MSFIADGHAFLVVLAVLAAEAAWLWRLRQRKPRVIPRYFPQLIAAAGLVGAAWLTVTGTSTAAAGVSLCVAFGAHVFDLLSLRDPADRSVPVQQHRATLSPGSTDS